MRLSACPLITTCIPVTAWKQSTLNQVQIGCWRDGGNEIQHPSHCAKRSASSLSHTGKKYKQNRTFPHFLSFLLSCRVGLKSKLLCLLNRLVDLLVPFLLILFQSLWNNIWHKSTSCSSAQRTCCWFRIPVTLWRASLLLGSQIRESEWHHWSISRLFPNLMVQNPYALGTSSEFEKIVQLLHQFLLDACQFGIRTIQRTGKFHSERSLAGGCFGDISPSVG